MGYYSNVALCLTKNGIDQLKTALAEAEKNNPGNFAAIKMLIGGEPSVASTKLIHIKRSTVFPCRST